MPPIDPLPPHTRLFHVGIPKSGTTALQMAATAARGDLVRQGVLYPGAAINQREAVLAFMGRRWGSRAKGGAAPPIQAWDELLAEIEAEDARRILFGHEFASEANKATARRFVEAIGERTHILVTLRPLGAILPSAWQQFVKAGSTAGFERWLRSALADPSDSAATTKTKKFHARNNQGAVVERWVKAAGPDRVTVIVADATRPEFLMQGVERLLDLAPGTLSSQDLGGFASNRGLTVPEVELFLALNRIVKPHHVDWADFERIVRYGAQRRVMEQLDGTGDSLLLPHWAAERAAELGATYAARIGDSGARVIGDLASLALEVPSRPDEDVPTTHVPIELAAEAMAGMLSAGTWRGPDFGARGATPKHEVALRQAQISHKVANLSIRQLIGLGLAYLVTRAKGVVSRGSGRGRGANPQG